MRANINVRTVGLFTTEEGAMFAVNVIHAKPTPSVPNKPARTGYSLSLLFSTPFSNTIPAGP